MRFLPGLTVLFLLLLAMPLGGYAAPAITAEAAILVDRDTGQIIWAKNQDRRMYPASLTKIMTGLLAVEEGNLSDVVTVSKHAASVWEGQVIELNAGDRLTLSDLVRAALIYSANDSTVAIGEHIAGTEKRFLELMNLKAQLIGATGTRYANTNGYTDPNHYTTARDLATITRFALSRPLFAEIVRTPDTVIHWIGASKLMEIHSTNRLLGSYTGLHGVKTGTTGAAGRCVVVSATRNNHRLIAVVLRGSDRWGDAARLLDSGFDEAMDFPVGAKNKAVAFVSVNKGRERFVPVVLSQDVVVRLLPEDVKDLRRSLHLTKAAQAPVTKGAVLGEMVFSLRGTQLAVSPLIATKTVARRAFWQRLSEG